MTLEEIILLANYVKDKVIELIPYSSNKPSINNQPEHRNFWLMLMRKQNDIAGVRQKILNWHMDLAQDQAPKDFSSLRVKERFYFTSSKRATLEEISKHINLFPYRSDKPSHQNLTPIKSIEKIENDAKNAIRFGIGNCGEMASLAFGLLIEYPKEGLPNLPKITANILIEYIYLPNDQGDHAFIVLNRKKDSCLTDLASWGDETVILDPWMDEVSSMRDCMQGKSSCYNNYIFPYQKDLKTIEGWNGMIGQGHSKRWEDKSVAKNRPLFFRDWKAYEHSQIQESVPWEKNKKRPRDEVKNKKRIKRQRTG